MKTITTIFSSLFFVACLLFSTSNLQAQTFRAENGTQSLTSIDSCSSISVTLNTYLGCINWQVDAVQLVVTPGSIDVQGHVTSSFICAGAISWPAYTTSVSNLSPGSYTVYGSAYTDLTFVNQITIGTLMVSSCNTTGITENANSNSFEFFPNPANDVLNIQADKSLNGNFEYEVMDLKGSIVSKGLIELNSGSASLDLSNITAGNYIVTVQKNSTVFRQKVSVQ